MLSSTCACKPGCSVVFHAAVLHVNLHVELRCAVAAYHCLICLICDFPQHLHWVMASVCCKACKTGSDGVPPSSASVTEKQQSVERTTCGRFVLADITTKIVCHLRRTAGKMQNLKKELEVSALRDPAEPHGLVYCCRAI